MGIKVTDGHGRVVEFGRPHGAVPKPSAPKGRAVVVKTNGAARKPAFPELLGQMTSLGWIPPSQDMSYEQYAAEGLAIALRHRAATIAVGDWLNHGEDRLGERYAQAVEATGYNIEFLRIVKWVAKAVPIGQRVQGLSFSHMRAVAPVKDSMVQAGLLLIAEQERLPAKDFEQIVAELNRAPKKAETSTRVNEEDSQQQDAIPSDSQVKLSLHDLPPKDILERARELLAEKREERKAERKAEIEAKRWEAPDLPTGKFEVIYADPPWQFDNPPMGTTNRSAEDKYPTMTTAQICALPVPEIAADDAVLFLWARPGMLASALQVMKAWGFEYRGERIWVKDKIGMGYYFRNQHEILLYGKRGEYPLPDEAVRMSSVFEAKRRKHSQKPEQVYDDLETYYPGAPKIELFQRDEGGGARSGWTVWGDMATKEE